MSQEHSPATSRAVVERHRRHVEVTAALSPEVRDYALMVCDDILNDLPRTTVSETPRFDGIVDSAKRDADRRALQAAITDEDVERALEAANGAMVDTRRHWTAEDRAAVRAMLEAVSLPSAIVPKSATDPRDAERYRWLREHFTFGNDSMQEIWFDAHVSVEEQEPAELDAAIDKAMKVEGPL